MPSRVSSAFDRAADVLAENYSEENEYGDLFPLKYFDPRLPAGSTPYEWPVVIGEETFQPVFDEATHETSVKRHLLADVRTPIVLASGITRLQPDAEFEWSGQRWSLDEATSEWTEEFVTFALIREPLEHKNECRRAAI
jgi:hypothetical protein